MGVSIPGSLIIKRLKRVNRVPLLQAGNIDGWSTHELDRRSREPRFFLRDKRHEETSITPQKAQSTDFQVHEGFIPQTILWNV